MNDLATYATTAGERYEAPEVLEDLPLEAFSLTCTKSTGGCIDPDEGGEIQS
ncbi:MAG: hypothetical protein JNK72_19810 [Myxococcales bacterium]|nr:hypothetical protein [Myxococcales bacterium]